MQPEKEVAPSPSLFVASSEDELILDFVREHLYEVRRGLSYFQIAGGDGVNVVANLRVVVAPGERIEPPPNTLRPYRSEDTAGSERPVY